MAETMVDGVLPQWPGERVDLGDRVVFVRSTPELAGAEHAVFVHGLAGSSTNWTDLMGELGDLVTGHALDMPGFGSSPSTGDYSVDAQVSTVAGYIRRLGVPIHLFGNSLGGAVSTRLAAEHPDFVRTLTLVSPALPDLLPRPAPVRTAAAGLPGIGAWAVSRLRRLPPERRITATLAMIYADARRVHPQRFAEAVQALVDRDELDYCDEAVVGAVRGVVTEYFRRGERNLWRQAALIQAPTLLIHGRHDRLVDPRMATRASRVFPRVKVVLLPYAGHVAQMEYPGLVAQEARGLITCPS
ncbi:alpha/beta fold hydrolase [Rhizohabitans arisaemae]|uniref:alpha/beta fold hydrolase n=1 Tax=Rhizohabitans arisaemae TaxID=2720610 RepID=UPI0024B05BC0|nr:alpha/beta hydrolase [Rhizohabitans arisaemae]